MEELMVPIIIGVTAVIALIIFLCCIYRVADIDKVLIVTGGKEPKIKVSGGSFVIPIFRKAQYFDLCMLTIKADRDEVKTVTAVPIIIDWTAQIRPDVNDETRLKKAIMSFKERGQEGIVNDVKLTLTGAVRDIVASMNPEDVLKDKQKFTDKVKEIVADEMVKMGMELVSLNIQDITDNNGYYDNMAAPDMQEKRKIAETTTAQVDQEVRTKKAETEKTAKQNELTSQLEIAEKERDNKLKLAEFRSQTDKAEADADAAIAGELQKTVRQQEVAAEQGRVEVVRQEQANLAAQKEKDVIATKAEAEKQKKQIEAEAAAKVKTIDAEAQVQVAEREANAVKIKAEAEAERIKKEGSAQAEVAKMKGIAEAEAEKAKLMAKAEGERALAEARASNEKVNFEIEKVKIETQARIEIATKTATIMAELGKNAQFVNIGGNSQGGNTGNALLDTLSGIPELMKILDTKNQALNGKPFNDELNGLVKAAADPIKGVLSTTTNVTNNISEDKSDAAAD